ncbi:hypothetical protein IPA_05105 [Ignicoccus pacificus DSM 13166]|uniref:Protein translocase subunit SecE n=1 Tax=Ignicoccus pacificus DSM 13166 TaxID=940294 RepID=A0A977PLL8_9CREN|nr:hypothetical protein IPA_05105 [Ignicoccus pacificus DSM 13166]
MSEMIDKYWNKLVEMIYEWRSILNKASKPSPEELSAIMKVVGLATIIIGVLAYVIRLLAVLFLFS